MAAPPWARQNIFSGETDTMYRTILIILALLLQLQARPAGQDSLSLRLKQLEQEVALLKARQEENELQKLRQEAGQAAEQGDEGSSNSKVFKSGQRSLQAINPEISFTGDGYALAAPQNRCGRQQLPSGFAFRVLGLHVQSSLDPFSLAKVALEFRPDEGVELGEVYVTWADLAPGLSLTAGKFRQQFGIVNRWHVHSLDQYAFPLALTTLLGEEGLNQSGLSLDWLVSAPWADATNVTLQITNGSSPHLFAGEDFSFPALLFRLGNYYDFNENTYLEIGFTGMGGSNAAHGGIGRGDHMTRLAGMDLTLAWEPVNRARYSGFIWRSELFYVDRNDAAERIRALGGYSYVQYRLSERWQTGLRFDITQPFQAANSGDYQYQWVPYLTWWQSHWARFRLEYTTGGAKNMTAPTSRLRLQLTWAIGPHKHERY